MQKEVMKRKVCLLVILGMGVFLGIGFSSAQNNEISIARISPSTTGFTIKWDTDISSTSQVEYGPTPSLGSSTPIDSTMVYRHTIKVLVPMSQGSIYYFRLLSEDADGNLMVSDIDFCIFDRVPPTVSIILPKDGDMVEGTVSINISAADDIKVEDVTLYIDHEEVVILKDLPYEFEWDTTKYKDGKHKISVYASDSTNSERVSIDVIIDNLPPDTTPPAVSIVSPQDGAMVYGKVKIIADVADGSSGIEEVSGIDEVNFLINGRESGYRLRPPYEREWNTLLYKLGEYRLQAKATDMAGNVGESEIVTVTISEEAIDITPPTTTDNYQYDDIWTNQDANITLTATDDMSGVAHTYYLVNGVQHEGTTINITEEGQHTVQYWSVDNAANAESLHLIRVWIDKTPPEVTISAEPSILWPPDHKPVQVTINGSATDALSGVISKVFTVTDEYNEVQASLSDFGEKIELIAWRNGDDKEGRIYTIKVVVTDKADNSTTKETVVTVPHDVRDKESIKSEGKKK